MDESEGEAGEAVGHVDPYATGRRVAGTAIILLVFITLNSLETAEWCTACRRPHADRTQLAVAARRYGFRGQ